MVRGLIGRYCSTASIAAKSLAALILLFLTPLMAHSEDADMFDKPENYYSLTVRAENMVARVYLNGALITFHPRLDPLNLSLGVDQFIRHGENTFTIEFEPIDPVARTYTPNEGVQIEAMMRQSDDAGSRNIVDLFHGRYSAETLNLQSSPTTLLTGEPLTGQAGTLTTSPRFDIEPVDMNYADRPSGEFARRLTVSFRIDDPSALAPPFDGAPVLTDTPELRDALFEAYGRLHTAYANQNEDAYRTEMSAAIDRFAYVRGFKGREDEAARASLRDSPLAGLPGETLRPLASAQSFQSTHLSFGSDNRMVYVSDHPITFMDQATGARVASVHVQFCMGSEGAMFVCHQPPR